MALKADYEFLFVGRDDNSFLENYSYDLFQEHGDKSGEIFINLEVQNNPVDAEEIGGVVFETMQKVFFEDVTLEPYTRFEFALKAVNGVIAEFKAQKSSGYIGNLNVIISAVVGDDLLLSQCGDAEAYLIRKRFVSIISEGLNEGAEPDDTFSSIASGKIESGDIVLFSSTRLVRYISKNDLAESVHRKNIIEALNEVKDVISTEILGKIGLTGIAFSEASDQDIEQTLDDTDHATLSILESDGVSGSAKKTSLAGKFVTALKGFRGRKSQVVHGGSYVGDKFKDFWGSLFSKGFGKNKILVLLLAVIVVLGVLIFFANSNRAQRDQLDKLDQTLSAVQDKIAEAETKGAYDKDAAKQILDKAYLDAKSVLDSGYYREKATIYLLQIEDARDKLDNVKRVENPKVLADLSKKNPAVNALGFALVSDRVFVFESNALYELVLDQIQDPLTIDDKEQVIAATGFDERSSVVFLTKAGKLIEYKDGTMSFLDTDDGSFRKAQAIEDWSNKIYLLDVAGNQVWKYTYKSSLNKFGTAEAYVSDGTDVSKSQDLAIDSNVYLLQNSGDILKFYGGSKAKFYINNAPFNLFKNPRVIYTNEKLDNVYVLDTQDGRVLVFKKDTKTGNLIYSSQYLFDKTGELRDLYVNADSKKMYVLTKDKVLEVAL